MKLDRNINGTGRGKYGLIKNRMLGTALHRRYNGGDADPLIHDDITKAIETLEAAGIIEWGETGTEGEFFVIKLRDKYASPALAAYASAARDDDPKYAEEIYYGLACKAGIHSPFCKKPD